MKTEKTLPAISMQNIRKIYRIGSINGGTLQHDLQSLWAKIRQKEDPNVRIGQDVRLIGTTFYALDGVSLRIEQGEAVGIIGANGAGKSTLLKLLSRITAPTEGEIDIYGRVTSMLEVGTGFHREMTGRENIYMNGAILGMSTKEIDQVLEAIIDFSEVRDFIDTPVKRYSSGMLVKLAFSVAAHLNSEIMIMDEVLAVGDMAFQNKCLEKMREAAEKEGRTVLYVSHNMNTIRRLCQRCIVMDQGKIIYDGEVEQAIAVYMENGIGENEIRIDLGEKTHVRPHMIQDVMMTQMELMDKAIPVYQNGETLCFKMTMDVKKPIQRAFLRLTFRTENDVGIGTAWSAPFAIEETGLIIREFALPLDQMAKGRFYISIGIYRDDDIGQKFSLDHITRAFRIEVEGIPVWNTNAHGYVQLGEIECKS